MITLTGALPGNVDESQLEVKPVAVTRWTARLVDPLVEQSFLDSRYSDDRRRVLVLLGFIAAAGALIGLGRYIAFLAGHGPLFALLPPLVPVMTAAVGAALILRSKTPQALEASLLAVGVVVVLVRFTVMTLQPVIGDNWLPLIVTSLFVIYLYLPVRLIVASVFASFYSAASVTWWLTLSAGPSSAEQLYFGLLWIALANGLGFAAANALQRGQRMQFAQKYVMQQLLATDALTGIANRRSFDEAIARDWRRCARTGRPLSLLMIDVDYFKPYNDRFGHQKGDACLRRIARVLVDCIAAPEALVARYGGEEFVCLLPGLDQRAAAKFARRVAVAMDRAAIAHPTSPDSDRVTLSVGVATADAFVGDETGLLTLADELLYAAKNGGRNRIVSGELPFEPPAVVRAA
ncbi:MAG: diguanylate cyclase domain-containing protein, partial [Pseudolabrys sp.]